MPTATGRDTRRWTGVVALLLAAAFVVSAAALLSPTVRRQLATSFQRQPSGYVELFFGDEASARACLASDSRTTVAVTLRSHLRQAEAIPYVVTVVSTIGVTKARAVGTLSTRPGEEATLATSLRVPTRRGYTVSVALTGRTEHLALHCTAPGAGS